MAQLLTVFAKSGVVVTTFNPSSPEAQPGESRENQASLVYIMNYRTARVTKRDPVLKRTKFGCSFRRCRMDS